ncbi:MAG: hypothetical protein ACC653_00310 [Gammaproteobacteria bacterium]
MQRNVVMSVRASLLFILFIVFNFPLVVNALDLEVTGYSTLLGTYTDADPNNIYEHNYADKYVDFTHQSRAGVQFNSKINEDFEFSLTLLMEGSDNYTARADWFYATYAASEDTHFRFGRLKVPFYMVSNYIDIGYAYPWVTPPPEVYSTNLIGSVDGIELVYDTTTDSGTNWLFELYFGSSKNDDILSPAVIDDATNPTAGFKKGDKILFDSHNMIGFEALVSRGGFTFRTGYYQALVDATEFAISGEITSVASVGVIVDWHHFVLYSEIVTRDSSDKVDVLFADQTASYVTFGYRFGHILPYITSAKIDGGNQQSIHALRQSSIGGGIRYEVSDSTAVKMEILNVKATSKAGDIGDYGLFNDPMLGQSANIYAMSLDILF